MGTGAELRAPDGAWSSACAESLDTGSRTPGLSTTGSLTTAVSTTALVSPDATESAPVPGRSATAGRSGKG
ncbi:unannotated protein [freshwater metagenome]|uniref:Unannotated protein n=1 Tax=freshwater metagenome TaxID=449393 RepID=A0A6J7GR86_9ZZZZ